MIGPYVGRVEQSIRTQPPGPRRRPPTGAAAAAVPGPGRGPGAAGAPAGAAPASRLRAVAGPSAAPRPTGPRLRQLGGVRHRVTHQLQDDQQQVVHHLLVAHP
ncbi:hypothetical protein ABZW03_34915, partial [Kitasatospora sp. NPDC004799]|uniref:hypothetical protein n=1 Tax=Kitasatospora sp. NPDC004799 TaxID=3154460 RepID=UPI0033B6F166